LRLSGRILIAYEDPRSAMLLRDHLEALGRQVDWAADGVHTVGMVAAGGYDVLILDVDMPIQDGVHVLQRLRRLRPDRLPPLIAVTADRLAKREAELAAAGAQACLRKPIDLGRLEQEIGRLLSDRSA
jgi:CheY-like chemotaxis protein